MQKSIQAIRGMKDILPEETPYWRYVERVLHELMAAYGYQEIRLPIVEKTELFKRTIGEVTDIVEKEMYSFDDRNGENLSLRPEGTAGCVRAGIEHGLLYNQIRRIWYMGPMFRHERPQKGRYRQFHQIGAEAYGLAGPDIDAEMILLTAAIWRQLGVKDVHLELNSLGVQSAREDYKRHLVDYFQAHHDQLDEDSQRRLHTNCLRILDSKNPGMKTLIANAPQLHDYLDAESRDHFQQLCARLDAAGVEYTVNPRLVRGLDYYSKTVFEWVTGSLGAQATVCAGGRYDVLVGQLGGHDTAAIGFAMGMERLIELMLSEGLLADVDDNPHVYLALLGEQAQNKGLIIAEQLRVACPQLRLLMHCGGGNFKKQLKKADQCGAAYAFLVGEDEITGHTVTVKDLRGQSGQAQLGLAALVEAFKHLNGEDIVTMLRRHLERVD